MLLVRSGVESSRRPTGEYRCEAIRELDVSRTGAGSRNSPSGVRAARSHWPSPAEPDGCVEFALLTLVFAALSPAARARPLQSSGVRFAHAACLLQPGPAARAGCAWIDHRSFLALRIPLFFTSHFKWIPPQHEIKFYAPQNQPRAARFERQGGGQMKPSSSDLSTEQTFTEATRRTTRRTILCPSWVNICSKPLNICSKSLSSQKCSNRSSGVVEEAPVGRS